MCIIEPVDLREGNLKLLVSL